MSVEQSPASIEQPPAGWYAAPDRKADYIAYTKKAVSTPNADGQAELFRSQVFVRDIPSVLVKGAKHSTVSGRDGSPDLQTTSFTFDGASLAIPGFTNDFNASLRGDDPAHKILMWAIETKNPVGVVIETARKYRNSDGDIIPINTPIHELRGAHADGAKGNANITRNNCKNIVAAVGQPGNDQSALVTSEAESDPTEWVGLRPNRGGEYAPAGWRRVPGGITQGAEAAAAKNQGAGLAEDAVENIAQQVAALLRPMVSSQNGGRPPQRPAVATEDQPWKAWNSDGRLNGGSWALSKYRSHFDWAIGKLAAVGILDDIVNRADQLAQRVLWMVDRVHEQVVPAHGSRRLMKSHGEASRWVMLVVDRLSTSGPDYVHLAFTAEMMSDKSVRDAWSTAVVDQAAHLFHTAYAATAKNLDPEWTEPVAEGQRPPARPQPRPTSAASPNVPETSTAVQKPTPPTQAAAADGGWTNVPAAPGASPTADPAKMHAADSPTLVARYQALLAKVGPHAVQQPSRFEPLLEQTFRGSDGTLESIPAAAFAETLAHWESAPNKFEQAGVHAFRAATQG